MLDMMVVLLPVEREGVIPCSRITLSVLIIVSGVLIIHNHLKHRGLSNIIYIKQTNGRTNEQTNKPVETQQ